MKALAVVSFKKTIACPSSSILLSFISNALSPEITTLVKHHLGACEFCVAELPLLVHCEVTTKAECKVPEIPINLRILAESLLGKKAKMRRILV
jgi:hypothetical protein